MQDRDTMSAANAASDVQPELDDVDRAGQAAGDTEPADRSAESDKASNEAAQTHSATDEAALADTDEVDERAAEIDRLKQQLLRLQADFDNFRKRTRQEREELQWFATRKLLTDLLPVTDNFDRALSTFSAETDVETVRAGVEMVHRQLLTVLQGHDVVPMDTVGQPFDPNIHEAVMQEPADDRPAGIVAEEFQKGYRIGDKVLRPAMVKVTV